MQKTVFITGTPKSEKESILDIMIPRYASILPKGQYVRLGKEKPKALKAKKGNLTVIGDIIEKTPSGYRIVNADTIKALAPQVTVVMHAETDNPEINEWQNLIKIYCLTNFSGYLKIIRVSEGNIKDAIKELAYTLKSV